MNIYFFCLFQYLLCSFYLYLPEVWGSSEARELQVIDVILRNNEWLLPLRNGIVPSKPPLFHWLCAFLHKTLGKELADPGLVRSVSAFFSTATLFLVIRTTTSLCNTYKLDKRAADSIPILCGVILSSTYLFHAISSDAKVDATVTFFIVASICCILKLLNSGYSDRLGYPYFLFFLLTSLAILSKGPLGIVLPIIVVCSIFIFTEGAKKTCSLLFKPNYFWLLPIVIAAPWYFYAAKTGGEGFIQRQLLFENIQRVVGADKMNTKPFWFYLPQGFRVLLPWSLVAVYVLYKKYFKFCYEVSSEMKIVSSIGGIWFASGFLFFSLVAGKRATYLAPLLPGFAIWLAVELYALCQLASFKTWVAKLEKYFPHIILMTLTLILLGLEIIRYSDSYQGCRAPLVFDWLKEKMLAFELLLFCIFSFVVLLNRHVFADKNIAYVLVFNFIFAFLLQLGLGIKGEIKGFHKAAQKILKITEGKDLIVVKDKFDEFFDPFFYYFHKEIKVISDIKNLNDCNAYILMKKNEILKYDLTTLPCVYEPIPLLQKQGNSCSLDESLKEMELYQPNPN